MINDYHENIGYSIFVGLRFIVDGLRFWNDYHMSTSFDRITCREWEWYWNWNMNSMRCGISFEVIVF